MKPAVSLRDYRLGDESGAHYVCMKTGDHGKDGEPFYTEDPDALGRIYVGPYLQFEPALALILEDHDGICGYAVGTVDSRAFYDRYEREWRPGLCRRFPAPAGDPASWSRVQQAHHLYHHPDYFCPEPYDQFPSHVHIDLLPRVQGRGYGRRMMEELMDRLLARGSPGVHLGLSAINQRAFDFYRRLGFQELTRIDEGPHGSIYMGKPCASGSALNRS
jgi:ribosomal protein S18 acetylase RimI-like enzyme